MSAAATAAGYLYASGRLRNRVTREEGAPRESEPATPQSREPRMRREAGAGRREPGTVRRAPIVGRVNTEAVEPAAAEKPRNQPRIEYRTRRWRRED